MKSCSQKGYEEIIVSFLAAESIYNNWCFKELSQTKNNNKTYSEWMGIHTSKSFYNQLTVLLQLSDTRSVNVKVFKNGQLQMTGVKSNDEGHNAVDSLIYELNTVMPKNT